MPGDEEIAGSLRSANVPVLIAVNKTDDRRAQGSGARVLSAGLRAGDRDCRRARPGTGDLLDEVVKLLPAQSESVSEAEPAGSRGRDRRPAQRRQVVAAQSVAAKKSASIVSDMPGTTRDSVDARAALAAADLPDRRHRRDPAGGPGRAVGPARRRQRHPRPAGDREGGRGGAGHRRVGGRGRPGRDDCRRGREGGLRHHHRRQQVGPDEGAGAGLLQEVRRRAAAADEVPRLRAGAPHLGGDRRARPPRCSRRSTRWPTRA